MRIGRNREDPREEGVKTKERGGYDDDHADISSEKSKQGELAEWQSQPPGMVKCLPNWDQPPVHYSYFHFSPGVAYNKREDRVSKG